jgi:integrase family protein with SAM-like domain
VNAFFASPRMLSRSPLTWKKYAQSLGMWLNFLMVLGRRWDEATEDDAEYFKEWRLSEQSNPRLVEASTFAANLAGLRKFYRWAARRYGVGDPVAAVDEFDLKPRGVRGQDVKWLDPAGYRRWRDLGSVVWAWMAGPMGCGGDATGSATPRSSTGSTAAGCG